MMYLNKNDAEDREQILFGEHYNPMNYSLGGIRHFCRLKLSQALKLVSSGFLDRNGAQNSSPTAGEFIRFIEEHGPDWYLHGYAVSPERDDVRVTVEGIGCEHELKMETLLDFVSLCRYADEFDIEHGAYCWYD